MPDKKVISKVPKGYIRQWVRCKRCKGVFHYDYRPYSLANPIMTMPCGHDFYSSNTVDIAADEAILTLAKNK